MEPTRRRLYRSRAERMISGVSGGIAEYFNVDPVLVRLAWVVLTVLSGGILSLAYVLLWIIIPLEGSGATAPRQVVRENIDELTGEARAFAGEVREAIGATGQPSEPAPVSGPDAIGRKGDRHLWAGGVLIALGVIFLLDQLNLVWWFSWRTFWPVLLIAIGALLLWQRTRT